MPASLVIGIEARVGCESSSPMYAAALESWAARRALRPTATGSQRSTGLASSMYLACTSRSPAFPPACSSARRAPSAASRPSGAAGPLRGRLT